MIKNFDFIPGLFDLYWDKNKNKFLISIKPEQFDKVYLANLTRKSGDGQCDLVLSFGSFLIFLKNYPIQYKWSMLIPLLGLTNLLLFIVL